MSEGAGEYEVNEALRAELLTLIDAGPAVGLSSKALHEQSELAQDAVEVARVLKALQREKLLSCDNYHRYYRRKRGGPKATTDEPPRARVARKGRQARKPRGASPRTRKGSADRATRARDTVAQALSLTLQAAQGALDEYVASVCDPAVLKPLRETRDAARRACEAFAGGATSTAAYS